MSTCVTCGWFRETRPASQLLARALPTTAKEVAEALGSVVEDEQKQKDAEAAYKRSQASAGRDTWPARPVMSDFCGLSEADDTFYIAEVKNAGGLCPDHDAAAVAARACSTCAHQRAPAGRQQDQQRESTYVRLAARNISADVKRDTTASLLDQYREGVSARQALEIAGAYQNKGHLLSPPSYLSVCAHFSTADDVVVCLFKNPHDSCTAWLAPTESDGLVMASSPLPSNPIPPVFGARASRSPAASGGDATAVDPVVGRVNAMLEWVLGIELDDRLRALVRDDVTRSGDEDLSGLLQLVGLHEEAAAQGPESLEFVRETVQSEVVAGMRGADDPAAQELVAAYDRVNPPIADGSPPLTQEVVDSYLGILSFVDALLESRAWAPVAPAAREEFTEQMAAAYPSLPVAQQAWLASVPLEWAKTRAVWLHADQAQREQIAEQLIAFYGETAQATGVLDAEDQPLAPPVFGATSAPFQAHQSSGPPVQRGNERLEDMSEDELLRQIIADQEAEEASLLQSDPDLALQVKLQNQLKNASMMSNMMNLRHQSAMAVINNIR